ncbi:MAG: hypothetical protein AB7T49_08585 [Oligoflexales bacterium]
MFRTFEKLVFLVGVFVAMPGIAGSMRFVNENSPVAVAADVADDVSNAYQEIICSSIVRLFSQEGSFYGTEGEIDKKARYAAYEFIDLLMKKPQPYYDVRQLGIRATRAKALSTSYVLNRIFGLNGRSVVLTTPGELKYITHSIDGMDVFVIAREIGDLTSDRSELVAHLAQFKNMRIHILWTGELTAEAHNLTELISRSTGGHYLDLKSFRRQCFPEGQI